MQSPNAMPTYYRPATADLGLSMTNDIMSGVTSS